MVKTTSDGAAEAAGDEVCGEPPRTMQVPFCSRLRWTVRPPLPSGTQPQSIHWQFSLPFCSPLYGFVRCG